jgi:hypothetical protein
MDSDTFTRNQVCDMLEAPPFFVCMSALFAVMFRRDDWRKIVSQWEAEG